MTDELKRDIRKLSAANSLAVTLQVVLMNAAAAVIVAVFGVAGLTEGIWPQISIMVLYVLIYLIIMPLMILLYRKTKGGKKSAPLKTCFCKPKIGAGETLKWMLITFFIYYASVYLSNILMNIIQSIFGSGFNNITLTTEDSALAAVVNFISIAVFAPVMEEIFFRGTIARNSFRFGTWSVIIPAALFFGMYHANLSQLFYASALGICAGFLIFKTGSIIPGMIVHFIGNIIGTGTSILISGLDLERMTSGDTSYITANMGKIAVMGLLEAAIFTLIISGLVMFIIELAKNKGRGFRLPRAHSEVSEAKKLAVYFTSPVTIVCTVVLLAIIIYTSFVMPL